MLAYDSVGSQLRTESHPTYNRTERFENHPEFASRGVDRLTGHPPPFA